MKAQLLLLVLSATGAAFAQSTSSNNSATQPISRDSIFPLHETSSVKVSAELGGVPSATKCDADGNLYVPGVAAAWSLLGSLVKIDASGKVVATYNPADFAQLALDRADSFTPAADGGVYQIAQKGVFKPDIYVLHFARDGSASSSTHLDAGFEPYTFAAFLDGTFLLSGVKRDLSDKHDQGTNFTAVFTADGRQLSQLSLKTNSFKQSRDSAATFAAKPAMTSAAKMDKPEEPTLDLAEAEAGDDGYLYVVRRSSPALIYVISPSAKIVNTFKIESPKANAVPAAFHLSGNRMAMLFAGNDDKNDALIAVLDAQTGRRIATYSSPSSLGTTFACYSANDDSFTFLRLEESGTKIVRADAN